MNKWKLSTLGEIAEIKGGKRVPKGYKLATEPTEYPYVRVTDFNDFGSVDLNNLQYIDEEIFQEIKNYTITSKDIYISIAGTIGKTGIVPEELDGANLTENACKLVFKPNVYNKFVYYFTQSNAFLEQAGLNTRKTAVPKLALSRLSTIHIPLPQLLEEQKRIVKILDEVFTAIDKAKANVEKNLQNSRELFDSFLYSVFANPGENWEEKSLDNVCIVERGSSPRPIKKYLTADANGVNWIKIGDTKGINKYISKTKERITPEGSNKSRYVKEGDFILSNSMSFGKAYIMKTSGYIHDGWFVLRLKDYIDTDFFYYLLISPFVQNQFNILSSGAIVKNINSDLVKKAILPIPSLNEQKKIAKEIEEQLSEIHKLSSIYQRKILVLDELKKSILQKAFDGQL